MQGPLHFDDLLLGLLSWCITFSRSGPEEHQEISPPCLVPQFRTPARRIKFNVAPVAVPLPYWVRKDARREGILPVTSNTITWKGTALRSSGQLGTADRSTR